MKVKLRSEERQERRLEIVIEVDIEQKGSSRSRTSVGRTSRVRELQVGFRNQVSDSYSEVTQLIVNEAETQTQSMGVAVDML